MLLLLSVISASAQRNGFAIGIKGGLNITGFKSDNLLKDYIGAGYHAGVFVKIPVAGALAIQTEALYSFKGARLNYTQQAVNGNAVFHLTYIDIAPLADLKLFRGVHLQAGPVISLLTDVDIRNKDESPGSLNAEEHIDKDNLHFFDPGFAAGLQLNFGNLTAGIRYNQGLRIIGKEFNYNGSDVIVPNARNKVYQAYIGLSFL